VAKAEALSVTDQPTRLSLAITAARVSVRKGLPTADLSRKLTLTAKEAKEMGLVLYELQARWALAELLWVRGQPSGARTILEALKTDATRFQLRLMMRKAADLINKVGK
jgi:hypothetical protein